MKQPEPGKRPTPQLFTDTPLALGLKALFLKLEQELALGRSLPVFLAGGMAVHLYTGTRVTTDVDAEFAGRIIFPRDLSVIVTLEDGSPQVVFLDTNYNSTFALLHEDYQSDAIPVDLGLQFLQVFVLSPLDLIVSKLSRFADNDRDDIGQLVQLGLASAEQIEARVNDALVGYIGNPALLLCNLRDVIAMAQRE
ncbi:MAG: hypothetical protein RL748_2815 [Pseudomonadota bacterium]|jgi:hypothetical protein